MPDELTGLVIFQTAPIRIDDARQFEEICQKYGMTASDVLTAYVTYTLKTGFAHKKGTENDND